MKAALGLLACILSSAGYIALKDMRTYYLKPPAVSWGIVFPVAWITAFFLRNPVEFAELVPGLIAMTALFSTTAAEAVVLNFELRLGSLERLVLAPAGTPAVLVGKVLGAALFGLIMTCTVTAGSTLALGLRPDYLRLAPILLLSLLVFASLGALLSVMVREVFEAQTLLNLPRFLMVFLSGVVYPVAAMPAALQHLAHLLPLTYTVDGLNRAFTGGPSLPVGVDALVLTGFLVLFIVPAARLLARKFQ